MRSSDVRSVHRPDVLAASLLTIASILVALGAALGTANHAAGAQELPPADTEVFVPALGYLANEDSCRVWIDVQNVGAEPTAVVFVAWGEASGQAVCNGPLKSECTGLIKPGASWSLLGNQIPAGSRSGALFSVTPRRLAELGVTDRPDDLTSAYLCESIFFGTVGNCAEYASFKSAFDSGGNWSGVPLDRAAGAPIAAHVVRNCAGKPTTGVEMAAAYRGVGVAGLGAPAQPGGPYEIHAALVRARADGVTSEIAVQNASNADAHVEVFFQAHDGCERGQACRTLSIRPGESATVIATECVADGFRGSVWLSSDRPVAAVIDTYGDDTLTTYNAEPRVIERDATGLEAIDYYPQALFGPLALDLERGWSVELGVQNVGSEPGTLRARLDHPTYAAERTVGPLCSGGAARVAWPATGYLPGLRPGSANVRIDGPDDPFVGGVLSQSYRTAPDGPVAAAAAYALVPEGFASAPDAAPAGGTEAGIAALALPGLHKDLLATGTSTSLALTNLATTPGWTEVAVLLYSKNELVDVLCRRLRAGETQLLDADMLAAIDPGGLGSAIVVATSWNHVIRASGGSPARNVVGIGAATVHLTGARMGEDIPGDETAIAEAVPLRQVPASVSARAMAACGAEAGPMPTATPRSTTPRDAALAATRFLPVTGLQDASIACRTALTVRNPGVEPSRALLLQFSESTFCPPQCAGPLDVVCSGLIAPGGTWVFPEDDPSWSGSTNAVLQSLNGSSTTVDQLCDTLRDTVVGDCDDYRRYVVAFLEGGTFGGIDLATAVGPPLEATVERECPDVFVSSSSNRSSYAAQGGVSFDPLAPVAGGYWQSAVPVVASRQNQESVLYLMNAGTECAAVELSFSAVGDCLRQYECSVFSIAPGETWPVLASECVGPEWAGSASILSSQPLAVAVDHVGPDLQRTRTGRSGALAYDLDDDGAVGPSDLALVQASLGAVEGDPTWNALADLDGNGAIDGTDVSWMRASVCGAGDEPPEPPKAAGDASQVLLPVLAQHSGASECASAATIQNVGGEAAKAAIVYWSAPSEGTTCNGPLKVQCTGLIRPGGSWLVPQSQMPANAQSAIAFSLTSKTTSEIGVVGLDDIVADLVCQSLFFAAVGDCGDYNAFKSAFDSGGEWGGVPMDKAAGSPLAVSVARTCGASTAALRADAGYSGAGANRWGRVDGTGRYTYHAPLVFSARVGMESAFYLQNGGAAPATARMVFRTTDDCSSESECAVVSIQPGETAVYDLAAATCPPPGWFGSARIESSAPLGVIVEIRGRDTLASYSAFPAHVDTDAAGWPLPDTARHVAFGPLAYDPEEGWDAGVYVQNLHSTSRARVRVEFLDGKGIPLQVLDDWICPGGQQSFYSPVINSLAGPNRTGSIRVESQRDVRGPETEPAPIGAIVGLTRYADATRGEIREALVYDLLPESELHAWPTSPGAPSADGTGVVALPGVASDRAGIGIVTEVAVTNLVLAPGQTMYALYLYDQNGLVEVTCRTLREQQVDYLRLDSLPAISTGFVGSAIVSAIEWQHPVAEPPPSGPERNLLGLAAVAVSRRSDGMGVDAPGDESAAALGVQLLAMPPGVPVPAGDRCGRPPTPTATGTGRPTATPTATRSATRTATETTTPSSTTEPTPGFETPAPGLTIHLPIAQRP